MINTTVFAIAVCRSIPGEMVGGGCEKNNCTVEWTRGDYEAGVIIHVRPHVAFALGGAFPGIVCVTAHCLSIPDAHLYLPTYRYVTAYLPTLPTYLPTYRR